MGHNAPSASATSAMALGAMWPKTYTASTTILIQEDAEGVGSPTIRVRVPPAKGKFLRAAGLDFREGDTLLPAGRVLDAIGQFTQRHAAAEPGS